MLLIITLYSRSIRSRPSFVNSIELFNRRRRFDSIQLGPQIDRIESFASLFALDILAIPAMATDSERV
jgi:hypothetical protein